MNSIAKLVSLLVFSGVMGNGKWEMGNGIEWNVVLECVSIFSVCAKCMRESACKVSTQIKDEMSFTINYYNAPSHH